LHGDLWQEGRLDYEESDKTRNILGVREISRPMDIIIGHKYAWDTNKVQFM